MYGGNDKTLDEVASQVKRTAIGQDEAVDWLCTFADAACARSRIIAERGIDSLDLPNVGSALIVGPTASGKSHLLKTFAKTSGLLFQQIDAGQMTAEGWAGNSFSKEWVKASAALDENPDRIMLVFIDEVDKMFSQVREGSAIFDLLKPLEGGILEGRDDTRQSTPYALDCDRCIFVMAGAFTGIEERIAARLGISRTRVGFGSAEHDDEELSEAGLRARIALDDVEAWGMPRELAGRLSTVRFLEALGEEALRAIVRRNKQAEYGRMLPAGAVFSIDRAAEDLLVANALRASYGARSINQQINAVFFGDLWRALSRTAQAGRVTLTARDGELSFAIEQGGAQTPHDAPSEQEILCANSAYELMRRVRNYLVAHGPLDVSELHGPLDGNDVRTAALLLCKSSRVDIENGKASARNDFTLAEITLLNALLALLSDWFSAEDRTFESLRTLLSMADARTAQSPLDLMFYQLESGARYIPNPDHRPDDASSKPWIWSASLFVRNGDGLRPADTGGLVKGQDRALDYYTEFKGFPRAAQERAIASLAFRLL